jgi:hypothetical protein
VEFFADMLFAALRNRVRQAEERGKSEEATHGSQERVSPV